MECQHLSERHVGFDDGFPVYECRNCGDVWVDTGIDYATEVI